MSQDIDDDENIEDSEDTQEDSEEQEQPTGSQRETKENKGKKRKTENWKGLLHQCKEILQKPDEKEDECSLFSKA